MARQIFDAIFNQRLNLFYTFGILIRHIPGLGVGNSREKLYVLRGTKSACIQSMVVFYRCVSLPAIQPTVELYPCFTMYTARFVLLLFACHCYDNCERRGVQSVIELRPDFMVFSPFYGTDVNMFACAVTIIVNMKMYNLWLNRTHVL